MLLKLVDFVRAVNQIAENVLIPEVCLQLCNVGIGPPVRFGHSDPCINVVGRSIEVAKPRPERRGTNHIKGDLKAGYDGDPLQVRRYVWPSRTDKPAWFSKEEIGGEESNGITGILQIDKSHWSPLRSRNIECIFLVREIGRAHV
jgi:hypothetical protein